MFSIERVLLFFNADLVVFYCSDLTMEIVRYRLIGPLSHSVLTETLEAATECDVRTTGESLRGEFMTCVWMVMCSVF